MGDTFFQIFLALLGIVISIYAQTIRREAQRRLLRIFGMLLFLVGGLWAGFSLGTKDQTPTLVAPTEPTLVSSTEISPPIPTNTPIPSDTPIVPTNQILDFTGYDFESGTQGWGTTEGKFKKAELSTTSEIVYEGSYALLLDTELFGSGSTEFSARNNDDVYRHTEALVYMNNSIPEGLNQPAPYDLTGKIFSCFVYLPSGLAVEGAPRAYIRVIAKDTKFANQFSNAVDITKDNVDKWIELSFVINSSSDTDFDPKQTFALGVRLDTLDGSTVQYMGPIYIDNCSIK